MITRTTASADPSTSFSNKMLVFTDALAPDETALDASLAIDGAVFDPAAGPAGIFGTPSETNWIFGTTEDDYLLGTTGRDEIHGSHGNDCLYGRAGDDTLNGGPGADVMAGGTGNDTYHVDNLNDVIWEWGGEGTDTVMATIIIEALPVGVENLVVVSSVAGRGNDLDNVITGNHYGNLLQGFAGHDTIYGEYGNDYLLGDGGSDQLFGGGDRDRVEGGFGGDIMSGGPDDDEFIFRDNDTGVTLATMDVITDFAPGDLINVALLDADIYTLGDQGFRFIGQSAFTGTPGEINYVYSGGNTIIQLQTGTSPDVDAAVVLTGLHSPEASWFVL